MKAYRERISSRVTGWLGVCLLLLAMPFYNLTSSKDLLPPEIMEQWQELKTSSPESSEVAELLAEGERIILHLQELEELQEEQEQSPAEGTDQRFLRLQERFVDLLRQVEMMRVASQSDDELEELRSRFLLEREQLTQKTKSLENST
ncbi:MAG: hypothetical protein ABH878_01110, partial [bacterium]